MFMIILQFNVNFNLYSSFHLFTKVVIIYCDEEYSGNDSERPEFNKLLEELETINLPLCYVKLKVDLSVI